MPIVSEEITEVREVRYYENREDLEKIAAARGITGTDAKMWVSAREMGVGLIGWRDGGRGATYMAYYRLIDSILGAGI